MTQTGGGGSGNKGRIEADGGDRSYKVRIEAEGDGRRISKEEEGRRAGEASVDFGWGWSGYTDRGFPSRPVKKTYLKGFFGKYTLN